GRARQRARGRRERRAAHLDRRPHPFRPRRRRRARDRARRGRGGRARDPLRGCSEVRSGPARVLEALRRAEGPVCSGETLPAAQRLAGAQIWKHVPARRDQGYASEAAAGAGYRLAGVPDRLYPEEIAHGLATRWLAREVRWLDSVDSTNRVALELARAGAA